MTNLLASALIAVLDLPDTSTDEEIIVAIIALKDLHEMSLKRLDEMHAHQTDIERQRLEALEILREAARLHFDATKKPRP